VVRARIMLSRLGRRKWALVNGVEKEDLARAREVELMVENPAAITKVRGVDLVTANHLSRGHLGGVAVQSRGQGEFFCEIWQK
jgi:hypothetical protein